MDNYGMNNISGIENLNQIPNNTDDFEILKNEYKNFKNHMAKSDFANSPVINGIQLDYLNKLAQMAEKRGKKDEAQWIQSEIDKIKDSTQTVKSDGANIYYTDILLKSDSSAKTADSIIKIPEGKNIADMRSFRNAGRKLAKSNISDNYLNEIIPHLLIDSENGAYLKDSDINAVISLKNALETTRSNEKKEHNNLLNNIGMNIYDSDNMIIVMKDNKAIRVHDKNNASALELQKEYDKKISESYDNIILNFIKKYNHPDTGIDKNAVRALIALRQSGISGSQVMNMLEYCINSEGEIDLEKINAVKTLKAAGMPDSCLSSVINSIEFDEDGRINKSDLEKYSNVPSFMLPSEKINELMPLFKSNPSLFDMTFEISQKTKASDTVMKLISYAITDDGNFDKNAFEIINNLYVKNDCNFDNESEFVDSIGEVLNSAKNPGEKYISDDAAGICAIMAKNHESHKNIITALNLCKNKDGVIDSDLSVLLWDLGLQNADIGEINDILNTTKNDDGTINLSLVNTLHSFFDSGESKEKIKEYLFS